MNNYQVVFKAMKADSAHYTEANFYRKVKETFQVAELDYIKALTCVESAVRHLTGKNTMSIRLWVTRRLRQPKDYERVLTLSAEYAGGINE